jgi:hypothetical protein
METGDGYYVGNTKDGTINLYPTEWALHMLPASMIGFLVDIYWFGVL